MPYDRKLYPSRAAAGCCPRCGGVVDDKKFKICSLCRAYQRQYYRKSMEKQTPEERAAYNARHCEATNRLYARRRQQGLCITCGAVSPVHWQCEVCYQKRRAREHENA